MSEAAYNRAGPLTSTHWKDAKSLVGQNYTCAYCGNLVASTIGFSTEDGRKGTVRVCSHCRLPTAFLTPRGYSSGTNLIQLPMPPPGSDVQDVPEPISTLYHEARQCVSVGAYTGAVLLCRKMLVNLAVDRGDIHKQNKPFTAYVEYLTTTIFTAPYGRDWLDKIRAQGNVATHELGTMSTDDAMLLIGFIEMLLRFLYEAPAKLQPPQPSQAVSPPSGRGNSPNPRPAGSADGGQGTIR